MAAVASTSDGKRNRSNPSIPPATPLDVPPSTSSPSTTLPLEVPLSSTNVVRRCRLVRRYKRFLADVVFPEDDDGSDEPENFVTVHCPNTGPMTGLLDGCPRAEAWVSVADDPSNKRKYKHTLEAIRPSPSEAIVGVHSAAANRVVRALLEAGVLSEGGGGNEEGLATLPPLAEGEGSVCAEYSFGKKKKNASDSGALSRADFLLKCGDEAGGELLLEVKSVTLAGDDAPSSTSRLALFPDTVSLRAQRHCRDLEEAVSSRGRRAAILFLIQRGDCDTFSPSEECDAEYCRALRSAASAGVSVLAVRGEVVVPCEDERGERGIRFRYLGRARVDLGSDAGEGGEKERGALARKRKK